MPGHETIFHQIPGFKHLEHNIAQLLELYAGPSWLGHEPIHLWHVFMALLVAIVASIMAIGASRYFADTESAVVPSDRLNPRTLLELITEAVLKLTSDIVGEKHARRFLPFLGTAAIFIFFSNICALIPGLQPPTSNLNTTAALGGCVFFYTHYIGVRDNGLGPYLKHFMGPVIFLAPLFFVIEVISHCARWLSLSLRLMGNIYGDHTVVVQISALGGGLVAFLAPVPIEVLGCVVAVVQTLVFCLLTMVYFSLAVEHEHHHDEGEPAHAH